MNCHGELTIKITQVILISDLMQLSNSNKVEVFCKAKNISFYNCLIQYEVPTRI